MERDETGRTIRLWLDATTLDRILSSTECTRYAAFRAAETQQGVIGRLRRQADCSGHAAVGRAHPESVGPSSTDAILDDYPDLEPEDIRACVAYAHAVVAGDRLSTVSVAEPQDKGHPDDGA